MSFVAEIDHPRLVLHKAELGLIVGIEPLLGQRGRDQGEVRVTLVVVDAVDEAADKVCLLHFHVHEFEAAPGELVMFGQFCLEVKHLQFLVQPLHCISGYQLSHCNLL